MSWRRYSDAILRISVGVAASYGRRRIAPSGVDKLLLAKYDAPLHVTVSLFGLKPLIRVNCSLVEIARCEFVCAPHASPSRSRRPPSILPPILFSNASKISPSIFASHRSERMRTSRTPAFGATLSPFCRTVRAPLAFSLMEVNRPLRVLSLGMLKTLVSHSGDLKALQMVVVSGVCHL